MSDKKLTLTLRQPWRWYEDEWECHTSLQRICHWVYVWHTQESSHYKHLEHLLRKIKLVFYLACHKRDFATPFWGFVPFEIIPSVHRLCDGTGKAWHRKGCMAQERLYGTEKVAWHRKGCIGCFQINPSRNDYYDYIKSAELSMVLLLCVAVPINSCAHNNVTKDRRDSFIPLKEGTFFSLQVQALLLPLEEPA